MEGRELRGQPDPRSRRAQIAVPNLSHRLPIESKYARTARGGDGRARCRRPRAWRSHRGCVVRFAPRTIQNCRGAPGARTRRPQFSGGPSHRKTHRLRVERTRAGHHRFRMLPVFRRAMDRSPGHDRPVAGYHAGCARRHAHPRAPGAGQRTRIAFRRSSPLRAPGIPRFDQGEGVCRPGRRTAHHWTRPNLQSCFAAARWPSRRRC